MIFKGLKLLNKLETKRNMEIKKSFKILKNSWENYNRFRKNSKTLSPILSFRKPAEISIESKQPPREHSQTYIFYQRKTHAPRSFLNLLWEKVLCTLYLSVIITIFRKIPID